MSFELKPGKIVDTNDEQLSYSESLFRHQFDAKHMEKLNTALNKYKFFEDNEAIIKGYDVIEKLSILFKLWVTEVGILKSLDEKTAQNLGGLVQPFGSFRLALQEIGKDIEAVCVGPLSIGRNDFFSSFEKLLQSQPEVTNCIADTDAYAPFIRLEFDGVGIKLLFVRIALRRIPDDLDLIEDYLLRNMDSYSLRSLDDCRIWENILEIVPNLNTYSKALGTIKLWATKREIDSSAMGYFGETTWAILVACICRDLPRAAATTIINCFFGVFSQWDWKKPIMFKEFRRVEYLNLPVWNLEDNIADGNHLMQILTPAHPENNSTSHITYSAKEKLVKEFKHAAAICKLIKRGEDSWHSLFEAPAFFYEYREFFMLSTTVETEALNVEWCKSIKENLHLLAGILRQIPNISAVHVNTTSFKYEQGKVQPANSPFHSMWFLGFELEQRDMKPNVEADVKKGFMSFLNLLGQYRSKRGFTNKGNVKFRCVQRNKLKMYLDEDILNHDKYLKELSTMLADGTETLRLLTPSVDQKTEQSKDSDSINDSRKIKSEAA